MKTKKRITLSDVTELAPESAERLDMRPRRQLEGMEPQAIYQLGLDDAFEMARIRAKSLIESELRARIQSLTDLLVVALKRPSTGE